MSATEAASAKRIFLLEMEIQLNGKPIVAGRGPVYGMEERNVEYAPGSKVPPPKLFRFSPFPVRYGKPAAASDFQIELLPTVPESNCTLDIELKLTSSESAFKLWLDGGLPESWLREKDADLKAQINLWAPDLASESPGSFRVGFVKYDGPTLEANKRIKENQLLSFDLVPEKPVSRRIEIPAYAGEKYFFELPESRIWWQRPTSQAHYSVWPRGIPEAAINPDAKPPAPVHSQKPPPQVEEKKTPFWMFWR